MLKNCLNFILSKYNRHRFTDFHREKEKSICESVAISLRNGICRQLLIKKSVVCAPLIFLFCLTAYSQNEFLSTQGKDTIIKSKDTIIIGTNTGKIYHLRPFIDIPIVVIGASWTGYAFTKIYNKEPSTVQEIMNLKKSDIPSFDRWAAGKSDKTADKNSDYVFYGSIPVPFALLIDKDIRQDAWKIGYLYLEAMSITGLVYTGSTYFVDRYRPETYNTSIPAEART